MTNGGKAHYATRLAVATYDLFHPGTTDLPFYLDRCAGCHAEDGKGVPFLIPDLALTSSVMARDPTSLLRVVMHGAQSVATASEPTAPSMPAFGWQLTDAQIAAVTTFVRNSWGHAAPATSVGDVHKARSVQ